MLSCYHTSLLLYMASTKYTLFNLICVIPLYLKFWLGLRTKTFWLLLPTFQERRTMMQMHNHAKSKPYWRGCLTKKIFTKIISKFQFQSEVDLFAVFVSYHSDPEAMHINTFSISWQSRPFYAFPPFAVIGKVLNKISFRCSHKDHCCT